MTFWDYINEGANIYGVVALLGGFIAAVVQLVLYNKELWRNPQRGPGYVIRSNALMIAFILVSLLAVVLLIGLTGGKPCPDDVALPGTIFVLLWIGFCMIWLIRSLPRDTALPAWIAPRFGLLDAALVAGIVICLTIAWQNSDRCGGVPAHEPAAQPSSLR